MFPSLYNYFPTYSNWLFYILKLKSQPNSFPFSKNTSRTLQLLSNFFQERLFQIFSTCLEFIAESLANWYKIWLWRHNKGCGKYHAGNLPQLEPYSYKKVFEQIYLSKAKGVGCNFELFAHHSLPASIGWVALFFLEHSCTLV